MLRRFAQGSVRCVAALSAPAAAAAVLAAAASSRAALPPSRFGGARFCSTSNSSSSAGGGKNGQLVLSVANVSKELKSKVPTLVYCHVTQHPEVSKYTADLCAQVAVANNNHKLEARGFEASGEDRDLAVRLAMVDCLKEPELARQFGVDPNQFPLVLFIYNQQVVDRLVGIIPEAQVRDAIDAFIKYGVDEVADRKAGKGPCGADKLPRVDNDDENVHTLIQAAQAKIKDKDFVTGEKLYHKAVELGRTRVQEARVKLGLDKKKMTPELFDRLKKDPNYFGLAQALAGTAMCHCSQKRLEEAKAIVKTVRDEFPAAVKELRDVAEAVVRIDLIAVTGYDLEKHNYVSLMKREELLNDPATFYQTQLKLAASHVFEKRHAAGIDECLRMIRAEPKLLPELKRAGVVNADTTLSTKDGTPARKVLFLIFEALGNNDENVIAARKKMAAYLSL